MKMPKAIGLVHFIGIGGIGMSGIAEVLHNLGHRVQGSDQSDSANVQRLRDKGIEVFVGHTADNLGDAEVVVVSTAIKKNNPELISAREKHLPIVRRAEMLAELMRFRNAIAIGGTHGKTTTTSMVATLLEAGNLDPTVINGGIINAYGTNARMGEGEWMVVEADESDGTFLKLPADVAVITNIDPEHLDHYGNFDAVRAAFRQFVENVPFYGFGVMCLDHPEVQALVGRIEDRKVITYGENPQADVRFSNVRIDGTRSIFDVEIRRRRTGKIFSFTDLVLPMPGRHNVSNATAAIAVANRLGISEADIKKGLASFAGVKRRFTLTGEANGVQVFDDYGHHPVEIKAVLAAARRPARGASSPCTSRTAIAVFPACLTISRIALTMLTRLFLLRSMPRAKIRSKAQVRKRWCRPSRLPATATPVFSKSGRTLRRRLQPLRNRVISWFSWGLGISRNGQRCCLRN